MATKREHPIEVLPDGTMRKLSPKEVRDWRKSIKTKIVDKAGEPKLERTKAVDNAGK